MKLSLLSLFLLPLLYSLPLPSVRYFHSIHQCSSLFLKYCCYRQTKRHSLQFITRCADDQTQPWRVEKHAAGKVWAFCCLELANPTVPKWKGVWKQGLWSSLQVSCWLSSGQPFCVLGSVSAVFLSTFCNVFAYNWWMFLQFLYPFCYPGIWCKQFLRYSCLLRLCLWKELTDTKRSESTQTSAQFTSKMRYSKLKPSPSSGTPGKSHSREW